jgi:hypothetical protein
VAILVFAIGIPQRAWFADRVLPGDVVGHRTDVRDVLDRARGSPDEPAALVDPNLDLLALENGRSVSQPRAFA